MQLKVMDVPWNLIGGKEIIINADNKEFEAGNVVKIWKEGKITAAKINKIDQSGKNTIRLDKHLRGNLSVEIGDNVNVEKLDRITDAEKVQVSSNVEMDETKVKVFLNGSIVCEDNNEHFPKEGVVIHISKTLPKGIVKVVQSTEIQITPLNARLKTVSHTDNKSFDISTEIPNVSYIDVGGLDNVKRLLTENIVYAMKKADVYKKIGYRPIKGIMLYGPPGTGKTLIAKATAFESAANFIFVPSSKLKNMYYGESERKMREIFIKAKEHTPCIIFFDEIDAIAEERTDWKITIVNQLLVLMDEIADMDIFVIGATNMIHLIDHALLRPGRFIPIEVPPPDKIAREQIFRVHLTNNLIDDVEFKELASATDNLTGAEISAICNRAKMEAMREMDFSPESKLEIKHLREAIKNQIDKKPPSTMYV
ncbi:VCP-like ATPase [uncultured archaeon]|nr:VCP-like ATPase [uncultured archaeon]